MHIRSLRSGEEAAWVRLNCQEDQFETRLTELLEYRHENPDLHPGTFLVAVEGDRIVGKLRTNTDDLTVFQLSHLSVDPGFSFSAVGSKLVSYAKENFVGRPVEAASWLRPEDQSWHDLLIESGFTINIEKAYFRRELDNYQSPYIDPFEYRSLAELGEATFIDCFVQIYPENLNRNFNHDNPRGEFFELKVGAGKTFDPMRWLVAYYSGVTPAGVVIPKVFDDIPDEGTIHTFGLFQEFRGRGLGKKLHAKGLADLAKAGVKKYVGSTDVNNLPMIATFKANGCKQRGIRRQYRLEGANVSGR